MNNSHHFACWRSVFACFRTSRCLCSLCLRDHSWFAIYRQSRQAQVQELWCARCPCEVGWILIGSSLKRWFFYWNSMKFLSSIASMKFLYWNSLQVYWFYEILIEILWNSIGSMKFLYRNSLKFYWFYEILILKFFEILLVLWNSYIEILWNSIGSMKFLYWNSLKFCWFYEILILKFMNTFYI